jgi:hypothetical protein
MKKIYETSRRCIVKGPQSVYRKGIQCNVEGKESCGNRTEVLQQVAKVLLKAIHMACELGYDNAFSLTKRWEHSTYGV